MKFILSGLSLILVTIKMQYLLFFGDTCEDSIAFTPNLRKGAVTGGGCIGVSCPPPAGDDEGVALDTAVLLLVLCVCWSAGTVLPGLTMDLLTSGWPGSRCEGLCSPVLPPSGLC